MLFVPLRDVDSHWFWSFVSCFVSFYSFVFTLKNVYLRSKSIFMSLGTTKTRDIWLSEMANWVQQQMATGNTGDCTQSHAHSHQAVKCQTIAHNYRRTCAPYTYDEIHKHEHENVHTCTVNTHTQWHPYVHPYIFPLDFFDVFDSMKTLEIELCFALHTQKERLTKRNDHISGGEFFGCTRFVICYLLCVFCPRFVPLVNLC